MAIESLIRPENLNSVEGLELVARLIVEGYLAGLNKSLRTGTGQEFSQYRSYQPGDDLRLLDWKVYGRSDRYYIRQTEVEAQINIRFVVDASASMNHEDSGITKLQYARLLAATLAYLATKQGDAIGLFAFSDIVMYNLIEKQGRQHYQRFLYELIRVSGSGKWPYKEATGAPLLKNGQKEMLIFITDYFENSNEISDTLRSIKTRNNEVVLLHLMGRNEIEFSFKGFQNFQDLETGETIQADTEPAAYKKELDRYLSAARESVLALQIHYERFILDQGINSVLPLFLKKRKQLI